VVKHNSADNYVGRPNKAAAVTSLLYSKQEYDEAVTSHDKHTAALSRNSHYKDY